PVPTPIPNPYIGLLKEELSTDVTCNNRAVGTKGSKSKPAGTGHIIMPPGTSFHKQPSNEGEVTLGTVPSVKVNGKEVAVLGSKVKTCADPADMENCSIFALGAAVPLPIKLPGMDEDEFKRWGRYSLQYQKPLRKQGSYRKI
ncbi:MAG: PAAR domain-containing protein, partial [Spirochaetota bacterium]|nr:PAAR domain-containing protein [Spirochaetota bacterium]